MTDYRKACACKGSTASCGAIRIGRAQEQASVHVFTATYEPIPSCDECGQVWDRVEPRCTRCLGSGSEPDWKAVGRQIADARGKAELTVRELAQEVGCSAAFVTMTEHGKRSGGLGGDKTRKILVRLGISPE